MKPSCFFSLTNCLEADDTVQIVLSRSFFRKRSEAVKINNLQTIGGILDLDFTNTCSIGKAVLIIYINLIIRALVSAFVINQTRIRAVESI